MKHIGQLSIYVSLLFVFLFAYGKQTFGQEKINIVGGFGFFDLLNLGVRYQVKQDTMQLGISIDIAQEMQSLSGDVFYHFGGYSKLSKRRPWYLKVGFNILHEPQEEYSDWYLLTNLRLGRDINLSKKVGINLEAGLGYSPFAGIGWNDKKAFPSFGIYFFIEYNQSVIFNVTEQRL